jgi:hypothetical protein
MIFQAGNFLQTATFCVGRCLVPAEIIETLQKILRILKFIPQLPLTDNSNPVTVYQSGERNDQKIFSFGFKPSGVDHTFFCISSCKNFDTYAVRSWLTINIGPVYQHDCAIVHCPTQERTNLLPIDF